MKDSPDVPADESPNLSIGAALAARNVELDEIARDAVDEHVSSDTHVEKGGVLVGDVDESTGQVTIVAAVPANQAVSAPASLTFTHEAWDEVNDVLARDYPDQRMVGWYHSHPRFGIFLSEYDTFIQANFFSMPWQLAYVVDPVLGKAGFFGWENDQLVRLQDWTVRAHGGAKSVREPERGRVANSSQPEGLDSAKDEKPRWQQQIRAGVVVVIALLVGFLLGDLLTGSTSPSLDPGFVMSIPPVPTNGMTVNRSWLLVGKDIVIDISFTNTGSKLLSGTVSNCFPKIQGLTAGTTPTNKPLPSQAASLGSGESPSCQVSNLQPGTSSSLSVTFASPSAGQIRNYGEAFRTHPQPVFEAT